MSALDMDVKQRAACGGAGGAVALRRRPPAAAPGTSTPSFSNDGRVSTLTSPDTFVAARGRRAAGRADRRRGLLVRHRHLRADGRLLVPARALHRRRRARHRLRDGRDGHDRDRGRVARRPTTCSCAPTAGSSSAGWRASTWRTPARSRSRATCPTGGSTPAFGAGGRALMRVGDGLRRDLRPRGGPGRPRGRDRAGPGRRARPLRARALRPSAARPTSTFDSRRVADRADLRAVRLRRGRHAAARRAHRRGRRVGPVLGRREPPLQRRAGRLQRRRRPRRGCARSARPTPSPTPPSRCPTGASSRPGVATERSGHPGMALAADQPGGRARPVVRTATAPRSSAPATARSATDVVLEPSGRAVAAGHSSAGAEHAFMLARFDGAGAARSQLRRPGRGAHRLPGHGDRARDRARAPGRRQARRRRHRLRVGQRPAVRRRDGAARARPLPGRRRGPAGPPGAGDPAAAGGPAAARRSSRCPSRLTRAPRPREGARALPAGRALPRQAQPAAAAREAQRAAARLAHGLDAAAGARRPSP